MQISFLRCRSSVYSTTFLSLLAIVLFFKPRIGLLQILESFCEASCKYLPYFCCSKTQTKLKLKIFNKHLTNDLQIGKIYGLSVRSFDWRTKSKHEPTIKIKMAPDQRQIVEFTGPRNHLQSIFARKWHQWMNFIWVFALHSAKVLWSILSIRKLFIFQDHAK